MRILAAPGETLGHQVVRVHHQGQTLYFLGDLYHHAAEVEHPTWMMKWDDVRANARSRAALTGAAMHERALLFATHIPAAGRLRPTATGVAWEPA